MGQKEKYDFGKNCVIVARVSTPEQTTSPQLSALSEFATETLGYTNVKPFGTTESGFLDYDDKQGWNLVVDFFEKNPDYRVLICTELSRLSRVESTLFTIRDYLIDNHIQLIVKDINFVLFNEFGEVDDGKKLIFSLFASLSNSEMKQKKERFKRALKEYKEQGYAIGGKELFGYTRKYVRFNGKDRSVYEINEHEKQEILDIYKWYVYGIDGDIEHTSVRTITQTCIERGYSHYLHSKRNVTKCLKEEAYIGQKTTHNKVKNPDYWNYKKKDAPKYLPANSFVCSYPIIFDGENEGLFELAQQRLRDNNSKLNIENGLLVDKSTKHTTILSKLIKCPVCGGFLCGEYRIRDKHQDFYYRCGKAKGIYSKCTYKGTINMTEIDSAIWGICQDRVAQMIIEENKKNTDAVIEQLKSQIKNLEKELDAYEAKYEAEAVIFRGNMSRVRASSRNDVIQQYEQKTHSLDKDKKKIQKRQRDLQNQINEIENKRKAFDKLADSTYTPQDKESIYNYIHKIIREINIIYSNRQYLIIKVCLNVEGDNNYCYTYIKKRSKHRFSLLPSITQFDLSTKKESKKVIEIDTSGNLIQDGHCFSVEDVFKHVYSKKIDGLMVFAQPLRYNILDVYDADLGNRKDKVAES